MGLIDKIKSLLAPPKEKAGEPSEQPKQEPADGSTEPVSSMGEPAEEKQPEHDAADESTEATATTDEQPDATSGEEPVPPTSDEPGTGKDSGS